MPADFESSRPTAPAAMHEVVRTHLALTSPADLRAADFPAAPTVRVGLRTPCSVDEYRALYAAVGSAYHWRDRLAWTDAALHDWLTRPSVAVWVLERVTAGEGTPAGYYELARHAGGDVEIAYFGLVAGAQGLGLGRALLTHAARSGWAMGATRVWVHTCTLDGPAALPNYVARGFRPYREERYLAEIAG